jgi:hypothetical protein
MEFFVKPCGQDRPLSLTDRPPGSRLRCVVWLVVAAFAVAALPAYAQAGDAPAPRPRCVEGGLALSSGQVVPLPGPCLAVHSDGDQTAVAGGEAGAWLVRHGADTAPEILAIPSAGTVTAVRLDGDLLAVSERVDTVRWIDLAYLAAPTAPEIVADRTPPEDGEPATEVEQPRTLIGHVSVVRGPRVFVVGAGVADAPVSGGRVAVVHAEVPRLVDPASGRVQTRGEAGYESVLTVQGNDGTQLVAELGRGDRAAVGDEVYVGKELVLTESIADPFPSRPLAQVGVELVPGVSLAESGVMGLGRAWVSYSFQFPMRVEIALRQGMLTVPRDDGARATGAAEVLASLDLPAFELGLTMGWQSFNEDTTGLLLGHYLRWGYRDGFLIELRTRFLLPPADFFGGVEGRVVIPMDRRASMTLAGGGGSSVGFGLIGVQLHAIGQGGRGSLLLNPAVGFLHTQWWDDGPEHRYHALTGPAVSLRVEYRP